MSRSIHKTKVGYSKREKFLLNLHDEFRQKRFYKLNEKRRRQSVKSGTPIYVTKHLVNPGEERTHTPDGRKIGTVDTAAF
jgi:hypothetical protein